MSQPTAANAETTQRCFAYAVSMLRTHRTVEYRVVDGLMAWCACGRLALACEVNGALRAAELLPALDRPGVVGGDTATASGDGGAATGVTEGLVAAPTTSPPPASERDCRVRRC